MSELAPLMERAQRVLERLEHWLPPVPPAPDWDGAVAHRWVRRDGGGYLEPIRTLAPLCLDDLLGIERQKQRLADNTRQFIAGRPANNALLSGSRGTGKSSLMKALLNTFCADGLRVVEMDRDELVDLPRLVELLAPRPERFIIFCDDLSFEAGDAAYKALKVALDGSLAATPENILIYATSNRRHLMPEYHHENLEAHPVDGEIHEGEAVEEKVSLSDRFGLWLSFYPFDQTQYLAIVEHWLRRLGVHAARLEQGRREGLLWARTRGSRTGRSAWQFARDFAGREGA